MGNLHDRIPTRGIQNPIPTRVELMAYESASEAWQAVKTDAMNHFGTNDIDKVDSTTFYEGLEDAEGTWQIVKSISVSPLTSMRFATIKNNPSLNSYSAAWAARASLTFDTYGTAF